MLLENLCQKWSGNLGDTTDGLSSHSPDLPNHEPRGCPRGASYSWYMYSANRLKYPKVRKPLLKLWREAKAKHTDPVLAWASIVENPTKSAEYKSKRGLGGFVRSSWQECAEIIAAANVYTAKTFGPDRIIGFHPFLRCPCSVMRQGQDIYRSWVVHACRFMIGIATCRQLLPWFGVSRPMLLNLLIGTIPIISLRGVQMCHKPVRLTLTFYRGAL